MSEEGNLLEEVIFRQYCAPQMRQYLLDDIMEVVITNLHKMMKYKVAIGCRENDILYSVTYNKNKVIIKVPYHLDNPYKNNLDIIERVYGQDVPVYEFKIMKKLDFNAEYVIDNEILVKVSTISKDNNIKRLAKKFCTINRFVNGLSLSLIDCTKEA